MNVAPILAGVVWFMWLSIICAKEAGGYSLFMLKWRVGNKYLHIHHWIYYLCAIVIVVCCMDDFMDRGIVMGMLAGGVVHGLTYDDWYKIYYDAE